MSTLGYEIRKIDSNKKISALTLYQYLKPDGSFDYERYRKTQIEGNKAKIGKVWVIEENIAFLADYLKNSNLNVQFGICHGTRRGKEQEWFRKYLDCEVIGTEISDNAEEFPYTIKWDFHEVKPEWLDAADFIYSNAFDHSYDPEKCLNAWMSCVRKGGACLIEHTSGHDAAGASELDPFGADIAQMTYLVSRWGNGRYAVRQLLEAPVKKDDVHYCYFIVIQKF